MTYESDPIRTSITRKSDARKKVSGPGIFVGRVIGHLDQKFMGGLKVNLLKVNENGNDYDETGQSIQVQYASPFAGQTPRTKVGANDTYQDTQHSYGMWMVPPDIGTMVLVTLVEGRTDFGFWIACIPDPFQNFTIPDGRTSTVINSTGAKLPVGEYNVALVKPEGQPQPTKYIKPVNTDFVNVLLEQGLSEDEVRGLTSSSARRELPSAVFGILTPGPLDKRTNAPTYPHGKDEIDYYKSRLGGTSIVMDDGDDKFLRKGPASTTPFEYVDVENTDDDADLTKPANELFRIRTRTGHQLLMHNTEDLIYIGNAKGTTWIEMTANGKIDIYAQDSVSIHTENDLNVTADRDINFTANENMSLIANKNIAIDAGGDIGITAINNISENAGENLSLVGQTGVAVYGNEKVSITSGGSLDLQSKTQMTIASGEGIGITGQGGLKACTDGDMNFKVQGNIYSEAEGQIHQTSALQTYITAGNTFEVLSEAAIKITSEANMSLKSNTAQMLLESATETSIKSGAALTADASGLLSLRANSANIQATGSQIHLNSTSNPAGTGLSADPAIEARTPTIPEQANPFLPIAPVRALQPARVPEHEPWPQHEHLNPMEYTPEKTRAGEQQINTYVSAPLPDTFSGIGQAVGVATSTRRDLDQSNNVAELDNSNFANPGNVPYAVIVVGSADVGDPNQAAENVRIAIQNVKNQGYKPVVVLPNKTPPFGHPLEQDLRILASTVESVALAQGAVIEIPKYDDVDPLLITPAAAEEIAKTYDVGTSTRYFGDARVALDITQSTRKSTVEAGGSTSTIISATETVTKAVISQDYPPAGTEVGGKVYCSGPTDGPINSAPYGTISGFSASDTIAYLNAIGYRESGLRYRCTNQIGFAGKYQFGGYALKEGGYIKASLRGGSTRLRLDPNNWTGKKGVNNIEDWLANKNDCQEEAMILYTNANVRYLKNNGAIRSGDTVSQIAGLLAGAHLLGPNAIKNWRKGKNVSTDANGTSADVYYALGSSAVTNKGVWSA